MTWAPIAGRKPDGEIGENHDQSFRSLELTTHRSVKPAALHQLGAVNSFPQDDLRRACRAGRGESDEVDAVGSDSMPESEPVPGSRNEQARREAPMGEGGDPPADRVVHGQIRRAGLGKLERRVDPRARRRTHDEAKTAGRRGWILIHSRGWSPPTSSLRHWSSGRPRAGRPPPRALPDR